MSDASAPNRGRQARCADAPVVRTRFGPVRGIRRTEGLEQFIEIPYGASTAGERRFRAPIPPKRWTAVRDVMTWTTRAAQQRDENVAATPRQWFALQGRTLASEIGEDCLTVNVWTPSSTDGRQRPVVVWVHGGGWVVGQAGQDMSDGAAFAAAYDAVFVSISHRLNAFGFLALDRIGGPRFRGSANAGLLDLIAGLRWIRDEISAFGGDPGNVTLVGESGGGAKVSTLLVLPEAQGLFHAAVCQSGVALEARSREQSEDYARRLIAQLGGTGVDALIEADMSALIDAQTRVAATPGLLGPGPVVDGDVLPAAPIDIWRSGGGSDVPVVAGTTRDEVRVFAGPDKAFGVPLVESRSSAPVESTGPFDFDDGFVAATRAADRDLGSVVEALEVARPGLPHREAAMVLLSEVLFHYPTAVFAEVRAEQGRRTWVYRHDWCSPKVAPLGSPHSSAVAPFFRNHARVWFLQSLAAGEAIAETMSESLSALMRTGSPQTVKLPIWPIYDAVHRSIMAFDDECHVENDPDKEIRQALDRLHPRLQH